jgi:hypothetical protein
MIVDEQLKPACESFKKALDCDWEQSGHRSVSSSVHPGRSGSSLRWRGAPLPFLGERELFTLAPPSFVRASCLATSFISCEAAPVPHGLIPEFGPHWLADPDWR